MPQSALVRTIAVTCLVLALVLLGWAGWNLWRDFGVDETADSGSALIGGPFALTDQFGNRRTDQDFRGRFMLVYFGYTYCPDVCPTELQTMANAIDALGGAGDKVTPIFITVDPARDTIEQLRAYAANFHPRLVALTGSDDEIAKAAKAYRVYYARADPDGAGGNYVMDHTSIVYLMGPDGKFLTHFGADATAEKMAETIRKYL